MHIHLSENLKEPETVGVDEANRPVEAQAEVAESPRTDSPFKDRLFQTHEAVSSNSRKYLKILGVAVVIVVAAGILISYLTLPRFGDAVRAPRGLEEAVRNHFTDKEKRTATDIVFYYCDSYYWARVSVEKRPDIKTNPIYQIDSYKARAVAGGENTWSITAAPITTPEMDTPCN